ncbi:hypothetical protein ID858_16270 [Xenorhabdus sp. DI]|uniref:DUF6201 family protein n=1 Tax=Xenorhabdus doucetiae TaxID=351671 RepID=UPI0019A7B027|nr:MULTISPECIES: DUF6201 family protein [unclassified Xenorhabdus]MBD2786229.1 hypothetical protein [Xenorhabdus sp. 3]MBD2790047.1 hypothetical protein [Xenorhabdus sp. DI]
MTLNNLMKKILFFILGVFFFWWFFLSHSTFLMEKFKIYEDTNGEYTVKYYKPLPTNLFGMYFLTVERPPVFVVLYDINNNYIGQSSPFYMAGELDVLGSNPMFPNNDNSDPFHDRFVVVNSEDFSNAYEISINQKKWWSKILQYFH